MRICGSQAPPASRRPDRRLPTGAHKPAGLGNAESRRILHGVAPVLLVLSEVIVHSLHHRELSPYQQPEAKTIPGQPQVRDCLLWPLDFFLIRRHGPQPEPAGLARQAKCWTSQNRDRGAPMVKSRMRAAGRLAGLLLVSSLAVTDQTRPAPRPTRSCSSGRRRLPPTNEGRGATTRPRSSWPSSPTWSAWPGTTSTTGSGAMFNSPVGFQGSWGRSRP